MIGSTRLKVVDPNPRFYLRVILTSGGIHKEYLYSNAIILFSYVKLYFFTRTIFVYVFKDNHALVHLKPFFYIISYNIKLCRHKVKMY